nr:tetratricopeptide repeat protein [Kiritimatiellia bacterium]
MESYADLVRVGRMKTRAGMVIGWLCGAAIAATGAESDPDSTGTAERSGAGLLVIQETATPGARADGIRSFADAGYAVDTCEWTDRNHPGPVLGALARMRLQLADDAVLVVLVDLPAILSGGEHLDASVQWGPGRSAVSSTSDGRAGIELMDTLVAWAAPPRGRLVILAMQPPSRTTPEVIEASRRAFESPDHGPVRHLVWPAAPGAATERSSREVTILESSLSDADLPRRLKGPDFHTKFWEGIFRRVRALSGGRQEAILWSAPGADAGPTTDIERAGLAAVARSPDEVSAWSEAFRAARESGRYGAALGLSAVASRLAGADPVSQAQWAMERADVQIQMGQPASARRDLLTGASGIDMPGFPVLVKFRFLVLSGELEEAEGRQIEANAVWGEALSIHALLDAPPDELAARMFCGLARTASASGREAEARQRFDQAREAASRLPPSSHHVITRMFADRARWHAKIGEWADAGDASLKAMEPVSSGAWPDEYALETARVVAERMSVRG